MTDDHHSHDHDQAPNSEMQLRVRAIVTAERGISAPVRARSGSGGKGRRSKPRM